MTLDKKPISQTEDNKDDSHKFEALAQIITIVGKLKEFDRKWIIKQISFLNKGLVIKK